MSKQTAAPPDVDPQLLTKERDEAKDRQKNRLSGLDKEQLIEAAFSKQLRWKAAYIVCRSHNKNTGAAFLGPKSNPVVYQPGSQLTAYYDANHPANATVNPAVLRGNRPIWILAVPGMLVLLGITFWPQPRNPVRK